MTEPKPKKSKALFVWCEPTLLDALRLKAHSQGTTVSTLVRAYLSEKLQEAPHVGGIS